MSLAVDFNQCVDLAVNPSTGTINTPILHNLLRIIINQLQLSTSYIEFHGARSAAIENHIVNNHRRCGLEISEFEMKEEVDEATGNKLKRRREISGKENDKSDATTKLFSVQNMESDCEYPMGYPLNPIQVLSIEQMQRCQTNSIHDLLAKMLPPDEKLVDEQNSQNPLKLMFDYINMSKRLEALEISCRHLGEILKRNKCDGGNFDGQMNNLGDVEGHQSNVEAGEGYQSATGESEGLQSNSEQAASNVVTAEGFESSDKGSEARGSERSETGAPKDNLEAQKDKMSQNDVKRNEIFETTKVQLENEADETAKAQKKIDPRPSLSVKVNELSEQIKNFECKCIGTDFEKKLMDLVGEKFAREFSSPMKLEMAEHEKSYKTSIEELERKMTEFKGKVCEWLDSFKNDLIKSMREIQDMLDSKLDKFFVPELKDYLRNMIEELEEKIENIDSKKALAAGVAKKIFKNLNCVSCGEKVIQADDRIPSQSMLTRSDEILTNINESQLTESLPTRLCGGNHTITTPKERIFQSKNCQNLMSREHGCKNWRKC